MEPGLTVAVICFAVAALALVHSYILYPLLLKVPGSSLPDERWKNRAAGLLYQFYWQFKRREGHQSKTGSIFSKAIIRQISWSS